MDAKTVDRRDALKRLALGGAATAALPALPAWVETLCASAVDHAHAHGQRSSTAAASWKPKVFTPTQNQAVIALSEAILPQTDTPGAKAAKVNEFIDFSLHTAQPAERDAFLRGLAWIDERSRTDFGTTFAAAPSEQQTALLTRLSAPDARTSPDDKTGAEFFEAIKTMTIVGYYTSEVGTREELGDDGSLFFAEFKGCTHPEHQNG